MTVPRYRENPLIIKTSMLCPGISQNTKHHHLTLYKGQVWREKSYLELCDQNVLNVVVDFTAVNDLIVSDGLEQNGELIVQTLPGAFFIGGYSQKVYESEILHSFAELTKITSWTFHYYDMYVDSLEGVTYQIRPGSWVCGIFTNHHERCVPSGYYFPWYIWTKEGNKI